jgi:hypothetical protein
LEKDTKDIHQVLNPKLHGYYVQDEIIFEEKFLDPNTEPDQGEIYLFNECYRFRLKFKSLLHN